MLTLVLAAATLLQTPPSQGASAPRPGTSKKSETAPKEIEIKADTPEAAVKTFVIAMLARDEKTLRAVTLPNPDFKWLMAGQPPTPEQLNSMKTEFAKLPIRLAKSGERLSLPGNRQRFVSPDDVGADRAVVLLPPDPAVPLKVRKIDGGWRVDPSPMIASRKASDAARRRKAAKASS